MRNIVMARIDDRLIHGQIATLWLNKTQANLIVIADDQTAKDSFMQSLLNAVCPKGVQLEILSASEAGDFLLEEEKANEKVFVMTKGPLAMLEMINKGVTFSEIILGNMGMAPGRKRFNKNVSASDEELQCFRDIIATGCPIYQQMVPTDSKVDLAKKL